MLFGKKRRKIIETAEPTPIREIWDRLKKNKTAMIALVIVILITLGAIFADVIADYDELALTQHPEIRNKPPSAEHWFGTDAFGRDLFARVIHGSRYSLLFGLVCTLLSTILGSFLGATAAYFGKKVEMVIMRSVDAMMSIPPTLLILVIVAAMGPGFRSMFIAMVISYTPHFTRMIHSVVITVVRQEYIEAARSVGASNLSIIFNHVLPNAIGPIIVNAMMNIAGLIMGAASLSFIGMGVQPPAPEWGSMLQEATGWMRQYPHQVIFPGIAIVLTSLSFNLLGDGMADALDPRRAEL